MILTKVVQWYEVPWLQGSVWGLLTFASVAVLWRAALWIKRRDDEAMARWSAADGIEAMRAGSGRVRPTNPSPAPSPIQRELLVSEDPLALPYIGMKQEDLLRILASLIVECCMAEELVRKSVPSDSARVEGPMYCPNCGVLAGVNPKADVRLRDAMKCLQGLKVCLGQLADCAARGEVKPETKAEVEAR